MALLRVPGMRPRWLGVMLQRDFGMVLVRRMKGMGHASAARARVAANAAAVWWASKLQQGDKEAFKASLIELVTADLLEHGRCRLECDYDPQGHVLTAVRAAGIRCRGFMFSTTGILPAKHSLTVCPDRLVPKEGYGNWTEEIIVGDAK